ncbi:Fic family protein [Lentimicrobium sp.]|uniref:Fic family protein n=1 Tax=Lentimicrobium sp. TaxID=2034841 RepID=UPI0025EA6CA2|nr:Fic family protein [Lentimicrobium sp.]MCO5258119.1 Fic family protein [Lentimicrobium sp.]HPJ63541.1 Fic family protein [Lentimicrobium sp.]HPR27679.1 Fic family protein [Lentimicrobium sp.]
MNFKAGEFIQVKGYKAFQPEKIDRFHQFDETDLLLLLEKANIRLGELNAYAELVPDVEHFIRLHVVKEATLSSRIEGTNTSLEDALLKEEEILPEKRNDWREVNNYILAMNRSIEQLRTLPLSSRLLKMAHKILLSGVRGEHRLPGEFRRSQNWIGGASLMDAVFIPPVWEEVNPLMGDLENFLHNENTGLTHILKIALAHYQFETIHPFLDGNGRIGRLMITLYLIQAGIMNRPVLYLSDFFDRNRQLYYDNLMLVRTKSDLKIWLRFFITGIIETCDKAVSGLKNILVLKKDCETNRIITLGKKLQSAQVLLQLLFMDPVIRPDKVAQLTGLSMVSAYKLIEDFERLKILREITGGQRNRIYLFDEYFRVFE